MRRWTPDLAAGLRPYASTRKAVQAIDAFIEADGDAAQAAKIAGLTEEQLRNHIGYIKRKAEEQGFAPEHDMVSTAPDTHYVKGVSSLYAVDENGERKLTRQWVKTDKRKEDLTRFRDELLASLLEEIPREKPVKRGKLKTDPNLLNLYVVTDYHFGLLAWGEETRQGDWDISIAEDRLVRWFAKAIEMAPPAEGAVICFQGDSLHFDGMEAVTPAAKHLLDADTRFAKMVRLWIRVRRRIHQMLLKKYGWIHLIDAEGNHDPVSSIHNREWWAAFYEDEPRVSVDQSPDPYYCFEWGDTSLFFHHGHKKKPDAVDDVFVAKFREVFGRTKFSYGHMGHMHHKYLKETNLMVVEQHRTLAESDAYASRNGWISGREAQAITYHKKHGEVGRVVITPEML